VERQKLEVEDRFAPAIDHIIDSYPQYCDISKLPGADENENLPEFLRELAEL